MFRQDIINKIIQKYDYKSYLEIGVASPDATFNKINVAYKVSVDPRTDYQYTYNLTSDDFFRANKENFDCIFIDGLHHSEQVYRDIKNSLKILNEGGTIVCHDMNPPSEASQIVPQAAGEWCGDCWKAWMNLRFRHSDLSMFVVNTDYGVGIIRKGFQKRVPLSFDLSYANFDKNRKEWLNLVTVEEFEKIIRNSLGFIDFYLNEV